jgi:hypothetical protein
MNQRRGSLYLLTGLILGIGLGLIYAWMIHPPEMKDTMPGALASEEKDQYRALIALAFVSSGDLVRAQARLELLGDADPYTSLVDQVQRMAPNGETSEVTALRLLAEAITRSRHGALLNPGDLWIE